MALDILMYMVYTLMCNANDAGHRGCLAEEAQRESSPRGSDPAAMIKTMMIKTMMMKDRLRSSKIDL